MQREIMIYMFWMTQNCYLNSFPDKYLISRMAIKGLLAGLVGRAWDFWSQGYEFQLHFGYKDYLEKIKKIFKKNCSKAIVIKKYGGSIWYMFSLRGGGFWGRIDYKGALGNFRRWWKGSISWFLQYSTNCI